VILYFGLAWKYRKRKRFECVNFTHHSQIEFCYLSEVSRRSSRQWRENGVPTWTKHILLLASSYSDAVSLFEEFWWCNERMEQIEPAKAGSGRLMWTEVGDSQVEYWFAAPTIRRSILKDW